MKRFIAAALTVLMLLALVSCGGKTADQLLNEANEKLTAAGSLDVDFNMELSVTEGENTTGINVDGTAKMVFSDTEYTMMGNMNLAMQGVTIACDYYMTDGTVYMSMFGQKIRVDGTMPENMADIQDEYKDIDLGVGDQIKKAKITTKDGISSFETALDGNAVWGKVVELAKDILNDNPEMLASSGASIEDVNKVFDSINADVTALNLGASFDKDGNFTEFKTDIAAVISVEDNQASVSAKLAMTFNNPGEKITIEAPTDLDEYLTAEEMNAQYQAEYGTDGVEDYSEAAL